jgi:hypothetical protein
MDQSMILPLIPPIVTQALGEGIFSILIRFHQSFILIRWINEMIYHQGFGAGRAEVG